MHFEKMASWVRCKTVVTNRKINSNTYGIKFFYINNVVFVLHDTVRNNGPFPSCCLSRFRSESWCSTFVREMSLICIRIIRNSFPFERLCTRTRFETEACSNSEMGYSVCGRSLYTMQL